MGRHRREKQRGAARAGTALASALLLVAGTAPGASADPLPIPPIPLPPPLGPSPEPRPKPAPRCSTTTDPFVPESMWIPDLGRIDVVAMQRDRNNVPGTLPTTRSGRERMAFDLGSGVRPGDSSGNALLNGHTWPDGRAIGNALLAELDEGDRLVLRGNRGRLCYRVNDRVEIRTGDKAGKRRYYDSDGEPQIAILVCSGKRLGPGRWTHRTIWYATPLR